jgi:DNA-directed RNA polymerase subunit RPC12/RpoP
MTAIEKAIYLLQQNKTREDMVEALHLIEKYLAEESLSVIHTKKTIIVKCVECGANFETKQRNRQRCDECMAIRIIEARKARHKAV